MSSLSRNDRRDCCVSRDSKTMTCSMRTSDGKVNAGYPSRSAGHLSARHLLSHVPLPVTGMLEGVSRPVGRGQTPPIRLPATISSKLDLTR